MARLTERLVVSIGFVCITLFLPAPATLPGQTPQEQLECSGRVVDSRARPVPGAEVVCYEQLYEYEAGQVGSRILGRTTTAENGQFRLEIDGEREDEVWVVVWKKGLALGWQGARFTQSTQGLLVRLEQPTVLGGTVVDENGKAVRGATVRPCLRMDWMGGTPGVRLPEPREWLTTRTDDQGRFRFEGIPAGAAADFWVEAPGQACCWTFWEKELSSSAGTRFQAGRTDVRITLKPETKMRGRVVDEDTGKGVAGVRLLARPDTGYANYSCVDAVTSGEDGIFLYHGLPADNYSLQVVPPPDRTADWVGKDVKVTTEAGRIVDVNIPVGQGGLVEITAVEAGTKKLIQNARATVSQAANFGRHDCWYNTLPAGADGVVRLRAPAGECHFYVEAAGYDYYREPEPVTVVKGQAFRRQIELNPFASVTGTVRDPAGQPAAGVLVTSKPVCDKAANTDSQGRFRVAWRPSASIREVLVLARDPQHNLAGLKQVENQSQPVEIMLEPAFTVRGRITDPNDKPIPTASVTLIALMTGWIAHAVPDAFTDANGVYELAAVPPARENWRYSIEVRAQGYGPTELRDLPFDSAVAKRVEVQPVALAPANLSISGVVVDANGAPAPGLPIFISGPRGNDTAGQPSRRAVTDGQGRFAVGGVCAGPLRIQAGWGGTGPGPGMLDAQGGDRDVKVILGRSGAHVEYKSLLGKPLPDLKEMIDLKPEQMQGKPILLCLFDMDQRPSRRWVGTLAKQAGDLEQKGVLVMALQAAKTNENDLTAWSARQGIRFPVGRIQGDPDKINSTWGVRSLPWLVLADRDHIVRAEGFALDEVDKKIEPVADKELPRPPQAGLARVIHFPEAFSLGRLAVRERGLKNPQDWKDWGGARGDVTVPAGKELRLSLYEAFEHRSHLAALGADDLQELYLSSRDLADADLDYLKGMTGLESLSLSGTYAGPCPLTGQGLAHLRGMTKLRSLMLDFTSVTDDQLAHLAPLTALEILKLHRNRYLIGDGLIHLQALRSLRELWFYVTPIEDDGLKHIAPLTALEALSLQSTHVTDAGLAHLEKLPRLRELVLPDQISDDGLAHVCKLASLGKLFLYSDSITDTGLEHLKSLPSLQSLTLCSPQVTRRGLAPLLAARPTLKLDLGLHFTTDAEMACLKELPYVTALSLGRSQVSDAGLVNLAGLTSLRHLNLSRTGVTDAGLLPLENLRAIENLDLDGTAIGDEGLAHLKHLTALDTLRLHGTRVTDAGLAHLAAMKSLTMLFLDSTDVTDAGLVHLKEMTKLSILFLGYTKITGPGLVHLTGLTSLRHLDLSGTPLTDAAVEHLKQMKHLQILSLNTTEVSDGAVEELRQALPDCTIRVSKS